MGNRYYVRLDVQDGMSIRFLSAFWCLCECVEHGGEVWDALQSPPVKMAIEYSEKRRSGEYLLIDPTSREIVAKKRVAVFRSVPDSLNEMIRNENIHITEIAKIIGIPPSTLSARLRRGMSEYQADEVLRVVTDILNSRENENIEKVESEDKLKKKGVEKKKGHYGEAWASDYARYNANLVKRREECFVYEHMPLWEDDVIGKCRREREKYGQDW